MDKFTKVMLFYLFIIILGAVIGYYVAKKTTKGASIGAGIGLLISLILYFSVGKKYIDSY